MKIRLENAEKHLNEKLKNPEFKKAYEIERIKVAFAQKIAEKKGMSITLRNQGLQKE